MDFIKWWTNYDLKKFKFYKIGSLQNNSFNILCVLSKKNYWQQKTGWQGCSNVLDHYRLDRELTKRISSNNRCAAYCNRPSVISVRLSVRPFGPFVCFLLNNVDNEFQVQTIYQVYCPSYCVRPLSTDLDWGTWEWLIGSVSLNECL